MHFKIDRETFLRSLQKVQGIVEKFEGLLEKSEIKKFQK
jgi:hypothetical protein